MCAIYVHSLTQRAEGKQGKQEVDRSGGYCLARVKQDTLISLDIRSLAGQNRHNPPQPVLVVRYNTVTVLALEPLPPVCSKLHPTFCVNATVSKEDIKGGLGRTAVEDVVLGWYNWGRSAKLISACASTGLAGGSSVYLQGM